MLLTIGTYSVFFVHRQKYQELFRLESRKDKRKLKKRQKSPKKSRSSAGDNTSKKPKKIYTTNHPGHTTTPMTHRFSSPSIRVEAPPLSTTPSQPMVTPTTPDDVPGVAKPHHRRRDDDTDDDDDEEESESEHEPEKEDDGRGAGFKSGSSSSNFQETFAKFRQSFLSSTLVRPKVRRWGPGSIF